MTMLPRCLERLFLTDIPSLIELPSFIQNFSKLNHLGITDCINLETLPSGINFPYLHHLDFGGCTRLKTFPDISTNMSNFYLNRTGIEEVPWWIKKFSRLRVLRLDGCNSLRRVSLNIYKMKQLKLVDFSDFGALAECSWTDNPSEVAINTNSIHSKLPDEASSSLQDEYYQNVGITYRCFNLDPEAILHNKSIIFTQMMLLGEEVPSYFTHRATGTSSSLTIPLLHSSLLPPFFRFRACAVVSFDYVAESWNRVYIHVDCLFKSRFGNNFDSFGEQLLFATGKNDSHLFVIDCRIPLNNENTPLAQLNYDQVDMQLHISNKMNSTSRQKIVDKGDLRHIDDWSGETKFKLKGWGIQLVEDYSSPENQLGNANTLPSVCEVDGENKVIEAEHEDELEDSFVDTERKGKRIRIT